MSNNQNVNLTLEKVSFVSKVRIILKCTSDDDQPIPGYMYNEICNITQESDGYCESTVEYLADRLNKPSCHVKLKALKLMKHLVENGPKNFRLGLIKHSLGIREATNFSGLPDPLYGNIPYVVVRKSAKELSELLFDTEKLETKPKQHMNIEGIGFDGHGRSETMARKGKMEGFGNSPLHKKKTLGESFVENIGKMAEKMSESPVDQQRIVLSSIQNVGGYKPPANYSGNLTTTAAPQPTKTHSNTVRRHVPGKAGGGWDEDNDGEDEEVKYDSSGSSGRFAEMSDRMEGITLEDWSSEEDLVVTSVDKGQNLLLTRREIQTFMKDCGQLNCDKVLELLGNRLDSDSEMLNMRSLLLIENILATDYVSTERVMSVCCQSLIGLVHHREGPVKSKAKKIVRILEKLCNAALLEIHSSCASNTNTNNDLLTFSSEHDEQTSVIVSDGDIQSSKILSPSASTPLDQVISET